MMLKQLSAEFQPFGSVPDQAESARIESLLTDCARRTTNQLRFSRAKGTDDCLPYAVRIGRAVLLHVTGESVVRHGWSHGFATTIEEIATGQLSYGKVNGNLLLDVVLAEGLERRENAAAVMFNTEYSPYARAVAVKFGGRNMVDLVENLAADLILPRERSTSSVAAQGKETTPLKSKIATYRGKTLLKSWLRTVVIHMCVTDARRRSSDGDLHEVAAKSDQDVCALNECEALLEAPLRKAAAAVSADERTLLKMLLLDGVPQNALARTLGVDAGTVSRRKHRASAEILRCIGEIAAQSLQSRSVEECLQLVLGGQFREVRQRIAAVIAEQFRSGSDQVQGAHP